MESNQIEVQPLSTREIREDKENVILRALVGDPNRHKPLAEHRPLNKLAGEEKEPAAMYTLETRYRPIPQKVLPTAAAAAKSHVMYHIEPKQSEQTSPTIIRHEPDTPPHQVTEFLEPKIIPAPILYAIVAQKNYPADALDGTPEVTQPAIEPAPMLYSLIARPRLQVQIREPMKDIVQPPPPPPTASLYSIVGGPELKADTRKMPSDIPDEAPPPPPSPVLVKKTPHETTMYSIIGGPTAPKKIPVPRKAKSLDAQPLKGPETPTLYTLVSKPRSPASVDLDSRPKPIARKRSPPNTFPPLRHSRSFEGKPSNEEPVRMPPIKNKRQTRSKEPTIPKSETIFIPLREEERQPRPKKARITAWDSNPEQFYRSPYYIARYDPLLLPDYRSPYAYHPQKARRERKPTTTHLPPLRPNRSERQARQAVHEPRQQGERRAPASEKSHSLERYPVNTKLRSRLWDYEHNAQTDVDDNDDESPYENAYFGRNRSYRRRRPRVPWVPVW